MVLCHITRKSRKDTFLNESDFSFLTGFNNLDFTWFSYFLAMKKQINS